MPSKAEIQQELIRRELQSRGESIPLDWETAGGQVVKPDWTNIGGTVTSSQPQEDGGVWDRIGANVQAGYTGVLQLGSSLVKLADKMGLAPEGSAEKAQGAYNEAEKIYQQGTYPETAVSKFAGEMLVPGGTPMKLASKAGGALLGSAGKYLGSAAGGAAVGATVGGLLNAPGKSPEDVWNEEGATAGALLGAPLGAAGQFISNYGKNVAGYQVGKEALKKTGYKGPVLARDYGEEVVSQVKSNWMDNIVATGIRDEQLSAITPAIKGILGKVTAASEKQGSHRVGQIIRGVNTRLENESNTKWQDLFESAKQQNISKIDIPLTKQASANFIGEYGEYLSKKDQNILNTLSSAKQVDFGTLNKVKGTDIWKMSEKFGKMEGSLNEDISHALKDIYWNITDDIGGALKSNPALTESWNTAKTFTRGVKELFNVQNNRKLINAIDDINENTGQLKTFINSVIKPVSSKSASYYNSALGESYKNTVSELAFNKVFNSSFSSEAKGLNLTKFFKGIRESDASGLLNNDTVKALSTLEKHFNVIQSAQVGAKNSLAKNVQQVLPYAQSAAAVGGYMAGGAPGGAATVAALMVGPKVLGLISKASPIKNILIGASNVYGKNPALTEYLMDLVGKKLTQAGVTLGASPEGVKLDRQETK